MYNSLIQTAKPLLKRKRQLATATVGLVVMTLTFGAGLGLMLPIFNFLLNEKKTLGELADDVFNGPLEGVGDWLNQNLPQDQFWGFMLVMSIMLVLSIIGGIGRFIHTYMVMRTISRVIQFWRIDLYRKMIRMEMSIYWLHGMTDGSSRIINDVEHLRSGFQGILVRSSQASLKVLIALSVAMLVNWKLTLLALVGGPIIAIVVRKFGKSVRKASKQNLEATAEMFGRLNESMSDLRVIKMHQAEGVESRRFIKASQKAFREQVRQHRVRATSSLVVETLALIGIIAVAGVSAWSIFKSSNPVPGSQFMTVLGALVAAGASFKPLSNLHHDLTSADAASERLLELQEQLGDTQTRSLSEKPSLDRHRQAIEFEGLHYTYPNAQQEALAGVDLTIPFGEMVAIVGGNGSGKSTLVAALTRLITPSSGTITIDGKDIRDYDTRSVREQMAMVTQKTRLFRGTIADNIAYGRAWTQREQIIEAAKAATADLFVEELPDGYDTLLGEGGEGVSGGQAQRLCIARAVLRDPAILILDEATSQVDTTSEALIAKAMEKIVQGRTTLVIAHRMSTIVHADRIVVMDQGKIVGLGKHDELLQTCPQYEALVKGQDDPRSDLELVDAVNRGEAKAFEALYHRHRDYTLRLAMRFTGERHLALDAVQDSFVYFYKKFPGFTLTAKLTTFLYPVVKHNALTLKQKAKRAQGDTSEEMLKGQPSPAAENDPAKAQSPDDLHALLRSLPDAQREVLVMRFVDGLSVEEIAQALEIPPGTHLEEVAQVQRKRRNLRLFFAGGAGSAIAAAAMITVVVFIGSPAQEPQVYAPGLTMQEEINRPELGGDLDADGTVDILDAYLLAKHIERNGTASAYDVNADGSVDQRDVDWIANQARDGVRGDATSGVSGIHEINPRLATDPSPQPSSDGRGGKTEPIVFVQDNQTNFLTIDLTIDPKGQPLGAYQIEMTSPDTAFTVVGVEAGEASEHPAFDHGRPPYFDPIAQQDGTDRLIVAEYAKPRLDADQLPSEAVRIVTIHVMLPAMPEDGAPEPLIQLTLLAAGNADGERIDADPGDDIWVIVKPAKPAEPREMKRDDDHPGAGAMVALLPPVQPDAEPRLVPMPLKHTDVNASVTGYIATVDVQQQFHNPFDSKIEAVYQFPLPQDAAVSEFVMEVGPEDDRRQIRGIIREKEEAERIYAHARAQGFNASLLTQVRPNIFEQKVANIEPGKQIDINIRYFNTLGYVDGWYTFSFPMVVGPRFNPADTPDPVHAIGHGGRADLSRPAEGTTVSYLRPNERSGHDINVALTIDAGVSIEEARCLTHAVSAKTIDNSPNKLQVQLSPNDRVPNKDFVFAFRVAGKQMKSGLVTHQDANGEKYFTLMLYPPAGLEELDRQPMEMVFVLDCSGSMSGEPMRQSKDAMRHALKQLRPDDTFQVIRFSNNASALGDRPLPATRENINKALRYVDNLSGHGGTQMIEGIKAALDFPHDKKRYRVVTFLTDGYIGNEQQILHEMNDRIGNARVFSFGVGSSTNRFLLDRMAKIGRGASAYLLPDVSGKEVMDLYFDRISRPAMTDLRISWGAAQVSEVYPSRVPDLIVGRPVILTGKYTGELSDIRITGRAGQRDLTLAIDRKDSASHPALAQVWARRKIADLMDRMTLDANSELQPTVLTTALQYNLVSAYTSFIARVRTAQEEMFMQSEAPLLFVYGTLKRGDVRAYLLEGQACLGETKTRPSYRLFNTGDYPALVEAAPLGLQGRAILGELWQVDPDCLARLDEEEGVDEGLYERRTIELAGTERAWVYLYLHPAGYGPMYGPMTVGCAVLTLPDRPSDAKPPNLWEMLDAAVYKRLQGRRGRIAINDSKKLTTKAAGVKHLELGLLALAGLNHEKPPHDVGKWLDLIGTSRHRGVGEAGLSGLPWYQADREHPWQQLPLGNTADEVTLASGMLGRACRESGVCFERFATRVIYEDEFNQKVALTRSKAAVNFTAVSQHLISIMNDYGEHHPHVAVDRQSGRTRYRELLSQVFEGAAINVLAELKHTSVYEVISGSRKMFISFAVGAEETHLPVALASMNAKYTRELLMQRFNRFFQALSPQTPPTAGYGSDANRWRDEILPHLNEAGLDHSRLRRLS
eukprot:g12160.t1